MKTASGAKEPVRIRQRKISNGNTSLYLDIYVNGARTYEFLRLYLVPERSRDDKEKNRETMALANTIKAQRMVSIRNREFGFSDTRPGDTLFFDFFERVTESKRGEGSVYGGWRAAMRQVEAYDPKVRRRTFADITAKWVEGFVGYLAGKTGLRPNSALLYISKVKACLNKACELGIITRSPAGRVKGIKREDSARQYLTVEEVRALARTPIDDDVTRRAFLFSCLTGLRRSDVAKMTWGEVREQGGMTRVVFRQKKTRTQEYLDIAPQAATLMGERGADGSLVFGGLPSPMATGRLLARWCAAAGITKHITFHCARHTFATMMLDIGTDLYTVSKLLGHREVGTTQIYAKIMDKNKRAAVARIPGVLPPDE